MSALMPPPDRLSLSSPTSDHHHLAQLYADWWNVLAQHGKHPSAETMDAADRELGDGKAALHFDPKTERWVVGDHIDDDDVSMSLAVSLAVPRTKDPRSGTPVPRGYTGDWPDKLGRIYHWNQGKRIKGPTTKPAPKVKPQTPANTPTRNRLARQGDIDHAALAKHAGELSDFHKKAAKRSLNALYYHHGELTLHRLHEMAGQMQKDMDSLPQENETGRGRIRQQLAKVAHMAELAKGKGVSGKGIPIPPPDADEDKSKTKTANKPYTGKGAVDDQEIKESGNGELEANGQKVRGRGARSGSVGSDAGRKPAKDKAGPGESPGKDGGVSGLPDGSVIPGKGDDVQNGGPGDGPQDSPATGVGRPVEPILNETHAEASVAEEPTKENPTDCSAGNFRYSSTDFNFGGDKAKFKANVAAVRTLRAIQAEGRTTATPEEQAIMSRYVGWGQFPGLFNYDKDWRKEAEEFKSLVSPEEFKSAQESIKNAHYTDPSVVEAHWKMAQKMGFKGGRFLETSAGIGYYMGLMPAEIAARTHSSAVEKDDLSGQMLKLLYPASAVNVQGFEEYQAPDDFYHLVASNVPFGSYGVFEKRYAKFDAPIHDHFFLKSADLAAPGGLIMHITSTGTMDKVDDQTRRELADKCELVAAFRMPGEMHREGAGTDVVTDMVILRKKIPGLPETDPDVTPPEAMPKKELFTGVTIDSLGRLYHWKDGKRIPNPDWMGISSAPDPDGGADIVVNKYFMDHPENILGRLDRSGTMRHAAMKNVAMASPEELTEKMGRQVRVQVDAAGKRRYVFEDGSFVPNADLRRIGKELTQQRLEDALERLPSGVLRTDQTSKQAFEPNRLPAPGDVEDGAYTIRDGKVYIRKGGSLVEQQLKPKEVARLQGLLELRDARRASINAQNQNQDATEERGALNRAYDSFVKKYGPVHGKANRSLYSDDPDWPNVCSLENYDRKTNTATKMPIFFRDTVSMPKSVEKVSDLSEALGITMHEKGHIDVARMAQLLGSSEADVYKGLAEKNLAFKDPSAGWQTGEEYLSGNVRRKLVLARAAAATDPDFARNVSALEKVQPADVDFQDINAKLGVGWIPPRDIKDFAAFLVGGTADDFEIGYNPITAKWDADYSGYGNRLAGGGKALTWGTPKAKFMKLFEAALNNGRVTIKDKEGEVDWTATNDANAKIDDIRKEFNDKQMNSGWLWENEERRNRLHRLYNDNFNNIVETKYNGQHLQLPGRDPGFNLFPHIKDFVWRVITKGTGYAGFEVGTGKAQPLDAKILTPGGWTRMGDIKVGDEVIAGDGTRTIVEAVFPQGDKDIFRVTFSDGAWTECCDEHLWLTQTYQERNQAAQARLLGYSENKWKCAEPKVRQLSEIRETLTGRMGAKNHAVPIVGQVDFFASPVPIDPYLLGVLLGDGSIDDKSARITTADDEIISHSSVGDGLVLKERQSKNRCKTWGIIRKKQRGFGEDRESNPFIDSLRELGLTGKQSHNKFIPESYKFNESQVRIAILQGLMDTDGTVTKKGTSVVYYTVSDALADDVVFLVRSLGGIVSRSTKKPTYFYKGEKRQGRVCHVLHLSLPGNIAPFRLKRKAQLVVPKTSYKPARYIVSVEPVGKKPAQCIRVAHPSHLYVTDDFVVTHNTATMVASAMELRRLGLAKKPALVCLKANIEQITKEALELYPGAKILSLVDKFGAKDRKEMLARIATGDYDMVIMTHDQLNKMKMKPEVRAKFIEGELDRVETAIRAAAAENPSKGNRIVKQLEDAKAKLLEKLKKATDESAKDDAIYFEDSGIDQLFVDEAHYFKNLPVYSKLGRVKGVPTAKSDRATNMLMRTQWLQQKNGGRGVVFLTGTPITNTMAELYNVQRYMQPDELAQRGLEHFDAWASQFTEAVPEVERTVSGEYKPVTRFRRFINLPELRHIASQVLDVQRAINLKKVDGSPIVVRPNRKDDTVKAPFTELQEKFMKDIGDRAEAMKSRSGPPEKGQDNMLSVCTDGRKGAIDMRLVDPNAPDDPRYKSNMMVANVLKAYKENPGKTQLIFSDIGVNETTKSKHAASVGQGDVPEEGEDEDEDGPPEDENDKAEANLGSNTGFHLYDDIINKLVKGGIPREKIADFSKLDKEKKAAAVAALKSGEISIAIGSSKKLGTGNNVQDQLLYEHNLDVPWVPADLEQRIGRGWRHGNQNKDVNIVNYVTEQSLDEMFWNTVSTKAKWINQFMEGNVADREIEEQNSEVLSPDQVSAIASGNPKRLEMVSLKEDVDKLQAAKNRHEREQREFQSAVRMGQSKIKDLREDADKLKELAAHVASQPEEFSIEIDGKQYDKRDEAKEALEKKIDEVKESGRRVGDNVKIGRFKGMDLYNTNWGNSLVGPNGVSLETGVGLGSVEHVARNIGKAAEGKESDYQRALADVASVQAKIGKVFKHEEALKQKAARLAELQGELRSPEERYHHQQEQMADAYNWEEGDAGSKKLGHFEVDRWGNVSQHGSVIGRMLVKDGGNAQSRGKALAAMLHQKLAGRYSFPYAEMDDVKKIIESFRSGSIPKDKDDRPIHIIDPAVVEKQREEAEAKAKRKKQSDYNKRELASALTSSYERQKELRQPPPSRLQPPEASSKADFGSMVEAAKAYRYLATKEEPEDDVAARRHQQHATKSALDAWLQKEYGVDAATARSASNRAGEDPGHSVGDGKVKWVGPGPEPTADSLKNLPWRNQPSQPPEASKREHWYGMRNRPPSPGAVPHGSVGTKEHDSFRHGAIAYDRPLTEQEQSDYELTPIRHDDEVPGLAKKVAGEMGDYVQEYLKPENENLLDEKLNQSEVKKILGHVDAKKIKDELRKQFGSKAQPPVASPSPAPSAPKTGRVDLRVPYSIKDRAKAMGARWDPYKKTWYATSPEVADKINKALNLRVGLSMDDDFEGCLLKLNERGEIEVYTP